MKISLRRIAGLLTCAAALFGTSFSGNAIAAEVKEQYLRMAPIEAYLMDQTQEISLARSAAPDSISHDATILVLGRHGYEIAIKGRNGFVCMVERGWVGALDWPEMWNPKIRGADCLNPAAARTVLPLAKIRTNMFLAGRSTADIIARIGAALRAKEVPSLEPGAMSYMMSKESYLTDEGDHDMPHLMFFLPIEDAALWGAGSAGSPVGAGGYWFASQTKGSTTSALPPMSVFTVEVGTWSDGTPAPMHRM